MNQLFKYITETPIAALATLVIGFVAGAIIVALYSLDLYRQNQEMKNSLGRPTRNFLK